MSRPPIHALRVLAGAALGSALLAGPALAAPDWTVDWGAVTRVRPSHLGGGGYRVDVLPVLQANYGDSLSLSIDDGVKWRAARIGPVAFGPIGEFRQSFNDALPKDGFRMRDAVELGGFAEVRTPVGVAEVRLRRALNSYRGWSGDLAFDTGGQVTRRLQVGAEARLSWADQRFSQEYFQQREASRSPLGPPRFHDEDYLTAGVELDMARDLTPSTRLVLEVSADHMLGELPARGLFPDRDIFTASIGVVRHWSTSPQRSRP